MMLLKTSSRKKTRWWFWGEEKRNQGVEKASRRWSSLFAATMDRLFRYGETAGKKNNKTGNRVTETLKHAALLLLSHQMATSPVSCHTHCSL